MPAGANGITHFDEAPDRVREHGHIRARWTFLGEGAGSVGVGLRRIRIPAGGWSTPVHEHGREEEIFYVLAGTGLAWHAGRTAPVGPDDCIVFLARTGGHTLHAQSEELDVLAFGPRVQDESLAFARIGASIVGSRFVDTIPAASPERIPTQFIREAALGPPELPPDPGPRPRTIVSLADVEPRTVERPRIARTRRNVGLAAGSRTTGLQHVDVVPGMLSAPLHCHSLEEELFVVLAGGGTLLLGDDEFEMRPGHVVSRPAGTGVAHAFRAGPEGLRYLAYGTREPADICYYPTSNKINFGGVRVIGRIERLDYWDGED
jgi:uncharacterized cupin superfamily protein